MKYYIVAGEASGDLHGGNLIRYIHESDAQASIRSWGGDRMQEAGSTLVKHYRDLAFMGFLEVVKNIRTILKNISFCKKDILEFRPDVVVFIDYPGFNLRIAEWAKSKGFKVVYYIAPQVWAWKENRVIKMKKSIDQMLVILPFEKDYFQTKWNWETHYVGHPLMTVVQEAMRQKHTLSIFHSQSHPNKPIIALLPGSRKQEILKKLPVMLNVCRQFPDYQFVIAKAPGIDAGFYDSMIRNDENVSYVSNQTYVLLQNSTAALVTSGTATLETALFNVPQVVCYKGNEFSYQIAKRLVNIKFISLVNLIMDREVVKELIQKEMNSGQLASELRKILPGGTNRDAILSNYQLLRAKLSSEGNASEIAAKIIVSTTQSGSN